MSGLCVALSAMPGVPAMRSPMVAMLGLLVAPVLAPVPRPTVVFGQYMTEQAANCCSTDRVYRVALRRYCARSRPKPRTHHGVVSASVIARGTPGKCQSSKADDGQLCDTFRKHADDSLS